MKNNVFISLTIFSVLGIPVSASKCGCKALSPCYADMLNDLREQDEAYCIEDAAIGTSTLTVFMQALQNYCGDLFTVTNPLELVTYDSRLLYQVDIHYAMEGEENIPTIVIDAGQEAGTESVRFALYIIEQLVGCEENIEMVEKVRWVIMPSTNPDGMEYARYRKTNWKKNLRVSEDEVSFGVDISRNFDENWGSCPTISPFSQIYQGPSAASENETIFMKSVLDKYKGSTKIYLSLKRDGHYIGYPYAYSDKSPSNIEKLKKVAAEIASKVNIRSGGVHLFGNDSIFNLGGKAHCGHSVDYAYSLGIPLAFEMRVFLETENRITSKFQTLPRGYESSLRNGYFTGIRELYNVLTNEKRYGDIFQ